MWWRNVQYYMADGASGSNQAPIISDESLKMCGPSVVMVDQNVSTTSRSFFLRCFLGFRFDHAKSDFNLKTTMPNDD